MQRQPAIITNINNLLKGEYVRREGWEPNYIITKEGLKISRVNLIAVVVSKSGDGEFPSIIIDDGTGKISVRSFENNRLNDFDVGDVVLIIGRPREFGKEIFIMPEIIRKIINKKWVELRKLQLNTIIYKKPEDKSMEESEEKKEEENISEGFIDKILNVIKSLDDGNGALIEEVISTSKIKNAEKIIKNLIEQGEVFEIRSGRIKILD
ncbi:hypothetical protein D6745_03650 [Candidatus Woesearchaeota archaeon]|nr:MAG: hypothetical protein D6745_03650 [Candidatus Woesearchaeota archaeon]